MEMTTTKTVAVFVVIFGCFAILYPRIFHPMLLHTFGLASPKPRGDDIMHKMPPNLQNAPGGGTPRPVPSGGPADDVARHLKPGPHPGLRAAAEMRKQASTTTGAGGKGMMTIILPMYAVGIVVYLVYTLTKVFGRKDNKPSGDYLQGHFQDPVRYDAERKQFVSNAPVPGEAAQEDSDDDEDYKRYRLRKKEQRDLERLLLKADKNDISQFELNALKSRLLETESQMTRILSAMGTIEDKIVSPVAAGLATEEPMKQREETQERLPEDIGAMHGATGKVVDSSPDMESYDIISGGHTGPQEDRGHSNEGTDTDEDTGYVQELEQGNPGYYEEERDEEEERAERERRDVDAQILAEEIRAAVEAERSDIENSEDEEDGESEDGMGPREELIESEESEEEGEHHPDLRFRKTKEKPPSEDCDDQ